MKALTIWQPWASLWLSPAKVHETRGWWTNVRGEIAVHAAKKFAHAELDEEIHPIIRKHLGENWLAEVPIGAIIGKLTLVDCKPITGREKTGARPAHVDDMVCGNWLDGRFAWERAPGFRVFNKPIPYRGRQGWFEVPDELVRSAA